MTYVVREDDEVSAGVQKLSGSKERVGELGRGELLPGAARSVQDQYSVGRGAGGIAPQGSQGGIVDPELGQRLAAAKPEIANNEVGFLGRRVIGPQSKLKS